MMESPASDQPTLAAIFNDEAIRHDLALFNPSELDALEQAFFYKKNKPHLICAATDKERPAKPEEIVRQLWIHRLMEKYGYNKERIGVEQGVHFGREVKRADVVIFDADKPDSVYIIGEFKKVKLKDGKEQLKSYCHATGAPIAFWSNGGAVFVYHRKDPNHFIELPDIPSALETIEEILGQPWTLETLIEKEKTRGRGKSLKVIIEEMEDEVLANAGVDVFEEAFKLIYTKLYDELSVFNGQYKHLRFRNTNTETDVKSRITTLFEDAKQKWEGVFTPDDRIKLTGSHLQVCVSYLEEYKLFNSNLDVVDEAFEHLINQSSKGEKGQYFTPRWVIDMCVKMLNPQEHETMIDTAAGSSGFTVHTIFKVWQDILVNEGVAASHLFSLQKKPPRCYDYVRNKIFAIDFDEKAVRVARCLNLIAGDGQTNVLQLNTLDFKRWDHTVKEEAWNDTFLDGWKKLRKLLKTKGNYREFNFDVLMANPPFAGDIKQGDMLALYELGRKENGKSESKVGRDLLFMERNLDFLRPGGRMAVVLPQGRFNNSSDQRVRRYIAERCRILGVVGLDGNTFKPHTGTKTSVLLVQKWNDDPTVGPLCPKVDDYNIFFATQRVPAKDTSGEKIIATDAQGSPMTDSHGHWIVRHDLFNVDGLTNDGIAEAFTEFAKKEGFSFFKLGPFNESRYRDLLEGLEITEILLSKLERTFRIDAEFFHKYHLEYWAKIHKISHQSINNITKISDGNHFSISQNFQLEGIPYYRGQDVVGHFFIEQSLPVFINQKTFTETHMHRSHLKKGDVLLSIVGTIGELSLVTSDQSATCSCKLAILRPKQIPSAYLATFLASAYGKSQIQRYTRGAVQMGFLLEDMDQVHIPRFQPQFENAVSASVEKAQQQLDNSKKIYKQAENTLLSELGLLNWQPPETLSYERKASEVFDAGRMDAEYFHPAKRAVVDALAQMEGKTVGEMFFSARELWQPENAKLSDQVINYDLTDALQPFLDTSKTSTTPDTILSTKKYLKAGDLVVSRLRSYLKEIAIVMDAGEIPMVGSTEFIVLRKRDGEMQVRALLIYLCSIFPQTIFKWSQDGSNHPRFDEKELLNLRVPNIVLRIQDKLSSQFQKVIQSRQEAKNLLERAKHAVEIAIETDEATALNYLNQLNHLNKGSV